MLWNSLNFSSKQATLEFQIRQVNNNNHDIKSYESVTYTLEREQKTIRRVNHCIFREIIERYYAIRVAAKFGGNSSKSGELIGNFKATPGKKSLRFYREPVAIKMLIRKRNFLLPATISIRH